MRHLVEEEGLADEVQVESAGTGDWHVGHPPDRRSAAAAQARGIVLDGLARQVSPADFDDFDLLLAADRNNLEALQQLAPDDAARAKVKLLRSYDPEAVASGALEVPDPYYGEADGFEEVLDVVERACRGVLDVEVRGTRDA